MKVSSTAFRNCKGYKHAKNGAEAYHIDESVLTGIPQSHRLLLADNGYNKLITQIRKETLKSKQRSKQY